MTEKKFWGGNAPNDCDICHASIKNIFIDGVTVYGPWGIMCVPCHERVGRGLGQGRGQEYQKQADGHFLKVEYSPRNHLNKLAQIKKMMRDHPAQ